MDVIKISLSLLFLYKYVSITFDQSKAITFLPFPFYKGCFTIFFLLCKKNSKLILKLFEPFKCQTFISLVSNVIKLFKLCNKYGESIKFSTYLFISTQIFENVRVTKEYVYTCSKIMATL